MAILSDKNVVETIAGSGVVVISKENAIQFLKNFKDDESIAEMRTKLSQFFERRHAMDEEISSLTVQIIDMYKYKRSDLITPVEIQIPPDSHVIGQSLGKLQVWHNTGATVIGIIQEKNIIISPGPYYEFSENEKVLIVGDENVIQRFNAYVNGIIK